MALVDEQGRLFGRFNLVDAIVVAFIAGLVPLGYGAYALFRTPAPQLASIEPSAVAFAGTQRMTILGTNLRPYMRVSFNDHQGRTFLFSSTSRAEVDVDGLPPGVYDVILYDQAQERARLPRALTIQPSPLPDTAVRVVGSFANLAAERAGAITKGLAIPGVGQILEVGRPLPEATRVYAARFAFEIPVESAVRLPAIIQMQCAVRALQGRPECVAGGVALQPSVFMTLPLPSGPLPFQIDQVMGNQPLTPVDVRVRFAADPVSLLRIRAGDEDLGEWINALAAGANVIAADAVVRHPNGAATRDVRLQVKAQLESSGWRYAGDSLKIGMPLLLQTPLYQFRGTVIEISPDPPVLSSKR